jgi:hypothetical protein
MKKLFVMFCILTSILLFACSPSAEQSSLTIYVSDAPADINEFDYVNVTFDSVRICPEGEQPQRLAIDNLSAVNLKDVQGEKKSFLVNTTVEPANYTSMELYVETVEASIDGETVDVKVPSEKLQLTKPFTVAPGQNTEFVFDIQVVLRGNEQNNQGYILRPNIGASGTTE